MKGPGKNFINLIWIVDGRSFKSNFDIYHKHPSPDAEIAADLAWAKAKRHLHGANRGLFNRISENLGQIHSIDTIRPQIEESYCGHHQYDWVKPRKTWLEATTPVYIDFGDTNLVQLMRYPRRRMPCIKIIPKKNFVEEVMEQFDISSNQILI